MPQNRFYRIARPTQLFCAFIFAALFTRNAVAQTADTATVDTSKADTSRADAVKFDTLKIDRSQALTRQARTVGGEKILTFTTRSIDSLKLPDEFIFRGTEKIYFDNLRIDSTRYRLDARKGVLYLRYLFRDTLAHRIEIRYRALPFQLKQEFLRRELIVQTADTLARDTLLTAKPKTSTFQLDDVFSGTELRRSGSLVRGITLGSNQDLNVTSGLRLQLEGRVAPGVEIAAALTDENTPIQPEGNTQTLQEFDRVFIEVRSQNAKATVGDFNLSLAGTEFANLERRLQGGKLDLSFQLESGAATSGTFGFANARGRFNINQFNGRDGVQGPYRLTGTNGEPFIIVLAGTERVYVDGEQMTRGQNNDYVIEYATGEIFFQPRRLITQQSRITVDFQFTDRLYPRNFLAGKTETSLFGGRVKFQASYLSESDDEASPIDFLLSASAIEALRGAGADRLRAVDTTAFVGVDTLGRPRGSYARVDTVVNGSATQIFRFVGQGGDSAFWSPPFSIVPDGQGSYRRVSFGIFEFVGEGLGNHVPVRLLPIPTAQSVFDLSLQASPFKELTVSVEGALSQNDLNKFSTLDDSLSAGSAYKFSATLAPKNVSLFGAMLGDMSVQFSQRFTGRTFAFIDRTLPVDLNRSFNLIDFDGRALLTAQTAELIRTASVVYQPVKPLQLSYQFGRLDREALFSSTRQELDAQLRIDSLTTSSYNAAFTSSRNGQTLERADWLRQVGRVNLQFRLSTEGALSFLVQPLLSIELSDKKTRNLATDTLRTDSHNILDATAGVRLLGLFGQTLGFSFGYRSDDLFDAVEPFSAALVPASIARTLSAEWLVPTTGDFLAQFNFTNRIRQFSRRFRERGNADNETFILRLQTRYTPFKSALEAEWLYDVSTEQTARLERQFFAVPLGRGNFIWRDRNQNGLREFEEYVPVTFIGELGDDNLQYVLRTFPSDRLFPTIDLRTSARLRLRPSRFFPTRDALLEKVISAISTETLVRLEERSTEPDLRQIYFLNFSRFQNDSTTLAGNFTIQQDVWLFENELTNFRFRFQRRNGLNQFSLGVERRLFEERSVRFVTRIGYELGIELNAFSTFNRSLAASTTPIAGGTSRQFNINAVGVTPDISYRPFQDFELGIRVSYEQRDDVFPLERGGTAARSVINSQQLRATYSFRGKGRVSAQVERNQSVLSGIDAFDAVFELTNGNPFGTNFIWRVDFDYRISQFITASAGYDGRALSTGRVINTGRAEVRAVF